MSALELKVLDKNGKTVCVSRGDDFVSLVCTAEYQEGDRIVLDTRSDFPHDNWWRQVTIVFSDGEAMEWQLEKSRLPHELAISRKKTTWIRLEKLIKADDPSPFPALSQIEVYGKDIIG